MKVSIITPCWGNPELARNLVTTMAMTDGVDFELILVDNGNGVPTDLPHYSWLKVVTSPHNLGFGGGNNFGAGQASGDVLLFLNNDIEITNPSWLTKLLNEYKKNPKSIIGHELIKNNDFTLVRGKHHQYINGYCIMMSKDFFQEIGGWDLGFGLGWFEDVWLCQEALMRGYKLIEVKTDIIHLGSQTIMDGRLKPNKMMVNAGYHFRDRVIKAEIPEGKMRIVFMVQGNYEFSDESLEGKGVGGAEQALIFLTRELAKQGHLVEVYNKPERVGLQNGVYYHKVEEFRYSDYADVFICFRNPIKNAEMVNAPLKLFWSCDQYTVGNYKKNVFPIYDKVICISDFHKEYFLKEYDADPKQIEVISLGVNLPDYEKEIKKVKGKMIFCSVPYRGLNELLPLYQKIKKQVPWASLFITSDYTLWGADPGNEAFKEMWQSQPDVHFLGKVPRQELVKHQLEAEVMAYPCNYDENFCISAAECISAGAIPVVFAHGALDTTIGKDGFIAKDDFDFVSKVVKVLKGQSKINFVSARKRFDWKILANKWQTLLYSWYMDKILDLKTRLPQGNMEEFSVLDLGCGKMDSAVSEQIPLIKFGEYTGVDIWEKDLEQAKLKDMLTTQRTYFLEDVKDFVEKNQNKKFDLIFLFDVLEHFEKKDALEIFKKVEKMCTKRIIMFMPIGKHTLEANDGRVLAEGNQWQKHLSEWSVQEWKELGYDIDLYKGFHQSGKLDAAWIMRDIKYMKVCKTCGEEFTSSYFFERHKLSHGNKETTFKTEVVPLAHDEVIPMPNVKVKFNRKIEISVNDFSALNVDEIIVPYASLADKLRIISEAYGDIVVSQEFVKNS